MNHFKENNFSELLNKTLLSSSMEDTEKLGANFSSCLDDGSIVYIYGDIGVGKSVFARGAIQSLPGGKNLIVRSPTFLYLFEYPTTPTVIHLDLYRLKEKSNLLDFGLDEWIKNEHVLFIEWPQHITENTINPDFIVEIEALNEYKREIKIFRN
tara:strand:- start:985 stop:1446 length:462 start_codon:yes stop_codon:yes gene_type:complete